jgi:hypothetical protein
MNDIGAWRSLVAHWHGGPGVSSSNLLAPTNFNLTDPPDRWEMDEVFTLTRLSHDKGRHGRRGAPADLGVQ